MGTLIKLETLGSIDLVDEAGIEIVSILSQPKRLGLLVFLACGFPRTLHRRDTLLALFWPESDPSHARNSLSQSLSHLRRNLPDGVLVTRGSEEIGIGENKIALDIADFESALDGGKWAEALTLYRGGFLQGFHVGGAWGFEDWTERERERLRERAAGAAWSLAEEQLGRGALVEAERTAQRAMDLVYTDESPVRKFIEALARAGDTAAALNYYERFSGRLREKLDLEPSPQTAKVAEDIRNGDLVPFYSSSSGKGGTQPGSDSAPEEETPDPGSSREERIADTETGSSLPPSPGSQEDSREKPFRTWILAVVVLSTIGILAVLLWPGRRHELLPHSIAVVPFSNQTGDPSLDFLGPRISREIEGVLGREEIGGLVSLPEVQGALVSARSNAELVNALPRGVGAGTVVAGAFFFHGGDSLLVQAHCVDVQTGEEIYPIPPAQGPREEVGRLATLVQDRVSATLAQHLDTAFALAPSLVPPPRTLEAYREFRRGYEVHKLGGTLADELRHFQRASRLDPTYLAPVLRILARSSNRPALRAEYESAFQTLQASLHGMTRFQKHHYDGIRLSVEGRQELAYREFLAMAAIDSLLSASALAEMAFMTNRPSKSIEAAGWLDRGGGVFLEPFVAYWQGYWSLYTYALHIDGQYEKQLEIALEWKDRFPVASYYPLQSEAYARVGLGQLENLIPIVDDWRLEGVRRLEAIWTLTDELRVHGYEDFARRVLDEEVLRFETDSAYIGRFNNQAMVLHRLGRDVEAHALWEAEINLDRPDPWEWGVGRIGFSAAITGDTVQAREMERLLVSLPEPQERYTPFLRAKIAAALGEKARAVTILEDWAESGAILFWPNNLHRDFTFQTLLGDYPPFKELMRRKG